MFVDCKAGEILGAAQPTAKGEEDRAETPPQTP